MIINYNQHLALEEALLHINDNCSFAKIDFEYFDIMATSKHPELHKIIFKVSTESMNRIEPEDAEDFAEELTWVASMASALEHLGIYTDDADREELDDAERESMYYQIRSAIGMADPDQIWNALHG